MSKVSVIIPTYNCAKYLQEAVESALSQTYMDIEVIVIDDGSTDGTENLIRRFSRDPRLKYIKITHSGLSSARNRGMDEAGGEYIAFLDADDLFLKDKIEKQVKAFEGHGGVGAVYTSERYFYEDDRSATFESPHARLSGDIFFFLKRSNFIHVSTVMFTKDAIGGMRFDASLKSHEDWDFFIKISCKGVRFLNIKEELAMVRVRQKSMTMAGDIMDSSRRIVGERAKVMWKKVKASSTLRYLSMRARAWFLDFPNGSAFNRPSFFKAPKLIFGSSVHMNFEAFLDLYKGVRKFYNDPLYIYASNEGLGKPSGNLVKIRSRRSYKWRRSQNFLFDAFEYLAGKQYDYFVAVDSDCLVCGPDLLDFIGIGGFDFVIYPNLNGLGGWYHGNVFRDNIDAYAGILKESGIRRSDERIVGNFNPLIIFSKKAVDFLREHLGTIESSEGYKRLMSLDFSVGETLVFNILKDAGFVPKDIGPEMKRGLRFRPYWGADEFRKDIAIYHPVRLKYRDLFRRLAGIRAGYDRNYIFTIPVFFYTIYRKIMPRKPEKGEGWFNP